MKLKDKKVLVTGGSGFLGRVIVKKLEDRGAHVAIPRSADYDLMDKNRAEEMIEVFHPEIVIHSAALYGGIEINMKIPADIYFTNMSMQTNVIDACAKANVKKFVGVGTACSYPGEVSGSMQEKDLWKGPCHGSVACYGAVKKMMVIQCNAYRQQFGFNGIHVMLANLYGPWDSYNTERSHVVAALIRKFVEAQKNNSLTVPVWGTGNPVREFLFVDDAAEGILRATEKYDEPIPLNIGTGIGTAIKLLVYYIKKLVEYEGEVKWDTSKPEGAKAKVFDITRMKDVLHWTPDTALEEGLSWTIRWFKENYAPAIERW